MLFRLGYPTISIRCFRIILLGRVAVLGFRAGQELRSFILRLFGVVGLYLLDLLGHIDVAIVV